MTDDGCASAIAYCRRHEPGSPGPLGIIQRRVTPPGGPPGDWTTVARTCQGRVPPAAAAAAPAAPPAPPTPGQIADLWRHTPFAKAVPRLQPPNGRTLVGLPTFVTVDWTTAGVGPGEIEHRVLLGYVVRIRPSSVRYVYDFGDGTVEGPTVSPGGPWPNGPIRHTYRRPGRYAARIDALYSGQASLNGGPWLPIAGEIPVRGAPLPLTVAEALNRLAPPE